MNWDTYVATTKNSKPRKLLVEALNFNKEIGNALDLGAGALNDTKFLLEQGFTVEVVDSNPNTLKLVSLLPDTTKVKGTVVTYDQYSFPKEKFDLVNAQYALPFNPPETFNRMFTDLTGSLKKNGVFVGQFFGAEDEWSTNPSMSFHTKEEIEALLEPYTVHKFLERKESRPTAEGIEKFWHVFEVIAIKKN